MESCGLEDLKIGVFTGELRIIPCFNRTFDGACGETSENYSSCKVEWQSISVSEDKYKRLIDVTHGNGHMRAVGKVKIRSSISKGNLLGKKYRIVS